MSPKFGRKFDREGQKIKKNWPFSSICRLNLLAKYSEPKNRLPKSFFHSELQELEVRICVQPNSPIIILILLTAFHKFAMSMGANHQCYKSGII